MITINGRDFPTLDDGLPGSNLFEADLRGADLRGADLRHAFLAFADLTKADLTDAISKTRRWIAPFSETRSS